MLTFITLLILCSQILTACANKDYVFNHTHHEHHVDPNHCWARSHTPKDYKNFLIGCILFKNEQRYLKEWLVYHQYAGFDHMYMYNHQSNDQSVKVLEPFVKMGFVTVIDWDGKPGHLQTEQVKHCYKNYAPLSMWTALFDVDEYIVSMYDNTSTTIPPGFLTRPLRKYYRWKAGIELYRANFDSNGHVAPPNELVMDSYTSRWTDEDTVPKLLTQHKYIEHIGGHRSKAKQDGVIVDALMRDVNRASGRRFVNGPLRLNHYITRSYDECNAKMNQTAFPGSWRSNALNYCDKAMIGTKDYYSFDHYYDDYLSVHFSGSIKRCMNLIPE